MLEKKIVEYRRWFHQHPELGYETYQTADYIYEELKKIGFEPKYALNQAAVLAYLDNHCEKTVAFRSDMDALKIVETTSLSFQSTNGWMHACGHDGHMAMLLGAANLLMEHRKELKCNVLLLFQPAEEGPLPGGALKLIDTLKEYDISMFFAFHVTNKLKTGQVGIKLHEACAAPDLWECSFTGKGCHGSTPKLGNNPILPAVEAVQELERLYQSFTNPFQVLTTTYLQAGVSMNIIPDQAFIKGTARSFQDKDRFQLEKSMKQIISQIALKYSVTADFQFHYAYDPVYNDDLPASIAKKAIQAVLGLNGFVSLQEPEMVGEDFSYYRKVAPICLSWLGVRGENQDFYDLHSSSFILDERALINGSKIYLEIAKNIA